MKLEIYNAFKSSDHKSFTPFPFLILADNSVYATIELGWFFWSFRFCFYKSNKL